MKATTIEWHLARDDQQKLYKFCEKHGTITKTVINSTVIDGQPYFENTYTFDNGGFITVELLQGGKDKGFTVRDHFQVVDYALEGEA